jgi:hypothetical protein
MIVKGVPDIQSMRNALEMGYELHEDGVWWPVYDSTKHDHEDFKRTVWPNHIKHQAERTSIRLYKSPDGTQTKEVKV